jgi:hypothetical protein
MKMNPKYKTRWIKALRSGKYKQGVGALKTESGKYCCLGVLSYCVDNNKPSNFSILYDAKRDKYGLTYKVRHKLVEMNDGGKSFKEIATWIENEL